MNGINPITQFIRWQEEARQHAAIADATAMCLATADASGQPSARMILLKGVNEEGFVFYTNLDSHKAADLKVNAKAALCCYWEPLGKQVRIEGAVEEMTAAEADAYFATRSRDSRIGAWASHQSQPLPSRSQLMESVAQQTMKFDGKEIPRPPFWSGWRVCPERIEFWQNKPSRLHDRDLYTRTRDGWAHTKLYP